MTFLKNRPQGKKMGIILLAALIIISLAEIIFRISVIGEAILTTANLGEQLAVIILTATILILTAKGKDRACYICYGAWVAYFALDQLYELPGTIITALSMMEKNAWVLNFGDIGYIANIVAMFCIIAIGGLLVEYMSDGTIYNRAFNSLCITTTLLLLVSIVPPITGVIGGATPKILLALFDSLERLTMVFLSVFFAYDSAKAQLKKTDLSK